MILALDSSGASCSVALRHDGAIVAFLHRELARGHAAVLPPMIREVLAHAPPGRLRAIAVVTGPGSFTGIRIAVAAARGLARALDRPLVGTSGFEAVWWRARGHPARADTLDVIAIDSRRAQPFVEVRDAAGSVLLAGHPADPGSFWHGMAARHGAGADVRLWGDGTQALGAAPRDMRVAIGDTAGASATEASAIAEARLAAGTVPDARTVRPLYLRAPL